MIASLSYDRLADIRRDLLAGHLTCRQLVTHYLGVIRAKADLNAFLAVYEDEALAAADRVDAQLADGTAGRLAGLVVGIKDVLCYQGHGLQASSRILDGFVSQFTATAVQRLLDEGAIVIGRQNCDEFAMGSSNENSAFGPVRNAADPQRVPGGSSGGSAVAVQAGMCLASLGTDTGGSVRQPAAFCGVMGLKPTYSRISRHGLSAYASSFDCIGIFARSVADVALLLETMAGADEYDSTVSHRPVLPYADLLTQAPKKMKIGYLEDCIMHDSVSEDIRISILETIFFLKKEGHEVTPINFSFLEYVLPTYYILTTAEASANLARFDGVRYGYRAPHTDSLEEMYKQTRTEGFGEEVKRRIMLGTFVLSASYYDAFYTKAQRVRRLIKEEMDGMMAHYDFILSPTTPTTAFRLGEKLDDPIAMYLADVFTVAANVAGGPAISVPNGADRNGMPIGLQVMSAPFTEDKLLAFAHYLTTKTP